MNALSWTLTLTAVALLVALAPVVATGVALGVIAFEILKPRSRA